MIALIQAAALSGRNAGYTDRRRKELCDGVFHLAVLLLEGFAENDPQRNYSRSNLEAVRDFAEEGSSGQRGYDSAFEQIEDSARRVFRVPGELPE